MPLISWMTYCCGDVGVAWVPAYAAKALGKVTCDTGKSKSIGLALSWVCVMRELVGDIRARGHWVLSGCLG